MDRLETALETDIPAEASPGVWAEKVPIILDGRPFSFVHHEYLRQLYDDNHPFIIQEKAAQLGCTTWALIQSLYNARYKNYKGVLYLFPSRTDTLDFSKSRIAPLITDNPETFGRWVRDTDAAGIKQIHNTFLYLRGMQSRVGLKSIPVDKIIFDELDEAPQRSVDMALERMGHSEFRETVMLSNPTIPDYGIDKEFKLSNQQYWLLKCPACNNDVCLEDTINLENLTIGCIIEFNGETFLACPKCRTRLDQDVGRWVAKKPGVTDRQGYHFSQLFSYFVSPAEILLKLRTTEHLAEFVNLKLGMAYVEAQNRLSVEEILALCGSEGVASSDPGPCSMGVDQGKDLHVVIGKRRIDYPPGQIVHLEVYKDWEDLDRLMKAFKVARCVVDAMPEIRNARAFAERFPGRVFLNYYQEKRKGAYSWNEEEKLVACNRTESLDSSHNELLKKLVLLPKKSAIVEEFAKHMANVAKKLETNDDTGSKRYVYVKLGVDHFRHAFNYEVMARPYANPMITAYQTVTGPRMGKRSAY